MVGLLLFTGSQSPLPVRYPHPSKPKLTLPPLVHRSLHTALDAQPPSALFQNNVLTIPQPGTLAKHAPADDHEVTVKIQVDLGSTSALGAIEEALRTLANHKGLTTIDTVLIGLPASTSVTEWASVWKSLNGDAVDSVKRWGTLGLGLPMLEELSKIKPPVVNELNVTDCTTLPAEYTQFAKSKGIHLWASGGGLGPEPLPPAEFHNLLHEFEPKLSALAPAIEQKSLSPLIGVSPDGERYELCDHPGVEVRWVLSYTLLSQTRNIVKDRGYIIEANIQ